MQMDRVHRALLTVRKFVVPIAYSVTRRRAEERAARMLSVTASKIDVMTVETIGVATVVMIVAVVNGSNARKKMVSVTSMVENWFAMEPKDVS